MLSLKCCKSATQINRGNKICCCHLFLYSFSFHKMHLLFCLNVHFCSCLFLCFPSVYPYNTSMEIQ
uniref:Uncharacterized protein n=1 Tax=Rhizophora mucronata TaxID=61149 RepID=A0A2P2NLI1_RHIMU